MFSPVALRTGRSEGSIPDMKTIPIIVREQAGQCESLALALQAIAASAKVDLDYDDLCAALGVSVAAVSVRSEPAPGWWMTYGRDAFLEPAARLFGIELRDLHPPDVAADMVEAEEFPQHFDASYRPLIARAVENGQPVLVWQGWPDVRALFWGVVTGLDGDDLVGTTLWSGGQPQPLTGPALQACVVERLEPVQPRRDALFAMAAHHADAYMNRALYAPPPGAMVPPNLVTGPAAFDAWETWLGSGDFKDPAAAESWREHRQHAEFVAEARRSAARFLRNWGDAAPETQKSLILEAADCCEALARRLAPSCDEETVRESFVTPAGRDKLLAAVHAAEADDRRLAMRIEQLAGMTA